MRGTGVCVFYVVRPGFLFCVWWWFPVLECSGLSLVRRKEGGGLLAVGLYEAVKIVLGNTVWLSFNWLFTANSLWM